jgi:hypothetical protein
LKEQEKWRDDQNGVRQTFGMNSVMLPITYSDSRSAPPDFQQPDGSKPRWGNLLVPWPPLERIVQPTAEVEVERNRFVIRSGVLGINIGLYMLSHQHLEFYGKVASLKPRAS